MYDFLHKKGHNLNLRLSSFGNMLQECASFYMKSGLSSLKEIPDNSIDFVFSQAVLEHIRKKDFSPTIYELYRILKPKGIASHDIDLRDHLGEGLNNLRYSDLIWESNFVAASGFYTNRIRFSEMLKIFKEIGFQCNVRAKEQWNAIPIARSKLNRNFIYLLDEDLRVSSFSALLTR